MLFWIPTLASILTFQTNITVEDSTKGIFVQLFYYLLYKVHVRD